MMMKRPSPFAEPLTRHRRYVTAVRTWVPGELVTAGMMNSIRDLFFETDIALTNLKSGKITIPGQAALDFVYAGSPTQLARLPAVAAKFPRINASGTGWEFAFPTAGAHDSFIGAAGMAPTVGAGVPCGYHETVYSGYGCFTALPFSGTATQQASAIVQMPRSWDQGPFGIWIVHFNRSGAGGNVYWTIYSGCLPNWVPINWSPANGFGTINAIPAGANYLQILGPYGMYASNAPSAGCVMNFLIQRVAAAGEDTNNDVVHLVGLLMAINTNRDSDG
jgi:hypothetical protein